MKYGCGGYRLAVDGKCAGAQLSGFTSAANIGALH
jgi:hypothetical protein